MPYFRSFNLKKGKVQKKADIRQLLRVELVWLSRKVDQDGLNMLLYNANWVKCCLKTEQGTDIL